LPDSKGRKNFRTPLIGDLHPMKREQGKWSETINN
jgi:hypothetical protein